MRLMPYRSSNRARSTPAVRRRPRKAASAAPVSARRAGCARASRRPAPRSRRHTRQSTDKDFDVSDVRDALSAFSRLISPAHKKLFDGIFNTLQSGLSKLGESSGAQTKAISELIQLIKDIPMDGKQDYDVLGFIYEYLISMFAANAGKKAGEFYTPCTKCRFDVGDCGRPFEAQKRDSNIRSYQWLGLAAY